MVPLLRRCVFRTFLQHLDAGSARTPPPPPLLGASAALARAHRSAWQRRSSSGVAGQRERTLIVVKPDGVQRRLVGQIIQRFERRGFKMVGLKMLQVSEDLLSNHYCQLRTKPFYPKLLDYMTSGPVVVMVWEGHNVIQSSRTMVGHTNPAEAPAGTVRGDFSVHVSRNVVHASDSPEGALREIQLWFRGQELLSWDCCDHSSTYEE